MMAIDSPLPPASPSVSPAEDGSSTPNPATDAPPPSGRKRGRPKLSQEERHTRAALVLQAKLANRRIAEIQEEFRISRASVYRALEDAKRLGLHQQARDFLTLNLIPLALHAYEEALVFGDIPTKVDVASRLLDGLGITGKHATLTVDSRGATESFEEFRASVIRRVVTPGQTVPPETQRPDLVVDALPGDPPQESTPGRPDDRGDHLPEPGE